MALWVQIQALPLNNCVDWGKLLNFYMFLFLVLKLNDNNNPYFIVLLRRLQQLIHTNSYSIDLVRVSYYYDLTPNPYNNPLEKLILPDEESKIQKD